jgi:hypothetical protein
LEQVLPRSAEEGEMAQTMYTHVSNCKNDKIKVEKKKIKHFLKHLSFLYGECFQNPFI